VPGWVWLFTGGVLGAFIMFLVYLADLPEKPGSPVNQPDPVTKAPAPEQPKIPKPRFDFYKLLQDSEEIVPATESTQQHQERANTVAPQQPREDVEYILQVGSFRNTADADRLRVQLLLLNLTAHIEQVTIREGELWHRVLVGPFDNQSRLASARSILVSNEYNALVLKRKPGQ
jgi:cell division protein FtsN